MKSKLKKLIQVTTDYQTKEAIILRDHLAMERTKLANERTLLSYIRASLYLLLGGIGLLGLKDFQDLRVVGYISLSLSAILLVVGVFRFTQLKRHLNKLYGPFEERNPL
jgi:putative membrane protein